jgi:hypothetical protein
MSALRRNLNEHPVYCIYCGKGVNLVKFSTHNKNQERKTKEKETCENIPELMTKCPPTLSYPVGSFHKYVDSKNKFKFNSKNINLKIIKYVHKNIWSDRQNTNGKMPQDSWS